MNPYPAAVAKMYRDRASKESNLRVKAACEERAGFYEALARETLDEYRIRTERENTKSLRQLVSRPPLSPVFAPHLVEWFGGEQPGHIVASDLILLLSDVTGRHIPPNQYGPEMKRLGFINPLERLWLESYGKPTRVWRRGSWPSPRYVLQRDANGRLVPRQLTASISPLLVAPLPY